MDSGIKEPVPSFHTAILDTKEKNKARLQYIKTGLKFKKVKPKRIYCDGFYEDDNYEKKVDAHTEESTHSSKNTAQQHLSATEDQTRIISLADFSSVHSGMSLESAAEQGLYNTNHVSSTSFAGNNSSNITSDKKEHMCKLCYLECDEHQYVCLSYNPKCKHIYHAKCMIKFLMKGKDNCPVCGELYLKPSEQ
jgi:hypothetical protein